MTTLALARTWVQASTNRRILGAAATVAVITLAVRAASLGKDLIVADRFGTGDALDAFLMALVLPSYGITVVAASLNSAFVPVLIEVREQQGLASARMLFRSVLAAGLAALLIVAAGLFLTYRWTLPSLAAGFAPDKVALVFHLSRWLIPIVVLSGLVTLWTGVLNATERFAFGAAVPAAIPIVTAIVVMSGGKRWGADALAIGTVGGYAANAILIAVVAGRSGWSVVPRWQGLTPELRRVVSLYGPVVAGSCLMGTTLLVDQAMASTLSSGSVSALNYGNKIVSLLSGLLTTSLATAVLPHFSQMVARGEWPSVRHTLRTWIRLIACVTVPLALAFAWTSEGVVRYTFQRGAFTAQDTSVVALVQAMFVLQVPFFAVGVFFVQALTAMQRGRTLVAGAVLNVTVNVALNYVLMRTMDVAGIALSTSVMYAVSCAFLGWRLSRAMPCTSAS